FLFAVVAPTEWAERLWQAVRPGAAESVANVPRTHHVLVLDASASMTARAEDGRTRFERAVAQAENLVRSGGHGDGYTVVLMAVVDTAGRDLDNLAVAEIALADPMPLVDQPVSVTVTVANLGRTEKKNVRVELLLGRPSGGSDSLVSVEQRPVDGVIPPGGRG